ncbi:BppU family phage baseplate upper protein [Staphylococcus warneri]|uniref:BppU family phage baseplate upper protein n=1 Tax=Staphylococcus warneri TaxID=1292 RepID=UPI001FB3487C|nr:BppU family phage baseplate upper protein [Staphylococcus warneri]MCJ1787225.1 BppU family phage baseplate upper protein [Staphylococcus warneri]MCJ1799522.1 BppU family phage baseplate upper protein [Staphylococcus warneri]
MIKKLIDVNTNINISSVENGFIGANFYTEDDGSAYIRITIKNNNEVLDFTKTDMLPRLDLFCSDGSIFTNEPIDIVYPEKGVIQYKVTDNVIQHAGKMDAKLFLGNKDDSVHVANFYFTISDSGMTGPIGKEIHVDSLKDLVEQVMRQNALGLLDDKFLSKVQDDLKTYVHDNNDLFKGVAGEKGDKGDKGDTGDTGPQGSQGIQGLPGKDGKNGIDGLDGKNGVDGIDGVDGSKGDKGDPFTFKDFTQEQLQGLKGEKGDRGLPLTYSSLTDDEKNSLKSAITNQALSDFKIGNNSIDINKVNFVTTSKNIFNKNDVIPGRVGSDGSIVTATDVSTTSYTKVLPNTTYITNQSVWINEHDNDFKFIAYSFFGKGKTFTTNANTSFIRFSCGTSNLDTTQIEQGTVITDYVPFSYALKNVDVAEVSSARKSISRNKTFAKLTDRFENLETDLSQLKVKNGGNIGTDAQAEQAFVDEMNKKVAQLGGVAKFYNSSGLTAAGQVGNAYDFNIFAIHASVKPEIASVWGQKTYTLNIKGSNARTVSVDTTVTSPTLENFYTILGGKTGTAGIIHNLTAIVSNGSSIYVGTVMKGTDDRFNDLKQAIDQAIKKDKGLDYDVNLVGNSDTAFSVVKYPTLNPLLTTNSKPQILLAKNETVKNNPASMTKIMTSIVMIENATNLNQTITFQDSDLVGGSGVEIKTGDTITLRDALYTMLLSSSNNTAKAVARVVGHNIINTRGYV